MAYWQPPQPSIETQLATGAHGLPSLPPVRFESDPGSNFAMQQAGLRIETGLAALRPAGAIIDTDRGDVLLVSRDLLSPSGATTTQTVALTDVGASPTGEPSDRQLAQVSGDGSVQQTNAGPTGSVETTAPNVDATKPSAEQATPSDPAYVASTADYSADSSSLDTSLASQGFTDEQQAQITQEVSDANAALQAAGFSSALTHF